MGTAFKKSKRSAIKRLYRSGFRRIRSFVQARWRIPIILLSNNYATLPHACHSRAYLGWEITLHFVKNIQHVRSSSQLPDTKGFLSLHSLSRSTAGIFVRDRSSGGVAGPVRAWIHPKVPEVPVCLDGSRAPSGGFISLPSLFRNLR